MKCSFKCLPFHVVIADLVMAKTASKEQPTASSKQLAIPLVVLTAKYSLLLIMVGWVASRNLVTIMYSALPLLGNNPTTADNSVHKTFSFQIKSLDCSSLKYLQQNNHT